MATPDKLKGSPAYPYKDYLLTPGSSRRPLTKHALGATGEATKGFRQRVASTQHQAAKKAYADRLKQQKPQEQAATAVAMADAKRAQKRARDQITFKHARGGTTGGASHAFDVSEAGYKQGRDRQAITAAGIKHGQQFAAKAQQQWNPLLQMGATGRIGGPAAASTFTPKHAIYPMWKGELDAGNRPLVAGVGWPIPAPKKKIEKKIVKKADEHESEGGKNGNTSGDD